MIRRVLLAALVAAIALCLGAQTRTLRIELFDRGNTQPGYLETSPVAKYIQKNFGDPNNAKIEIVLVPRAKEEEKLNIMMAAGDAPDVCFTYSAPLVSRYVSQGGLADLTNLAKQYGPNLEKFLSKATLSYGYFDGKLFAIPAKRQFVGITGTWIRKDWLDALKLPIPKTTAEFIAAMRAFRDKDPGKVGKDKVVPWGVGGGDGNLMYSMLKIGTERDRAGWYVNGAGGAGLDLSVPGYKEYLKAMNGYQHEGLLPKDWALWPDNDMAPLNSLITTGQVGAFTHNWAYFWLYGLMASIEKTDPKARWVPCDPFTDAQGKTPKFVYAPVGMYLLVPTFSKNADLAVKYLNWLSDNKVLQTIMYGVEGQHWDKNADGLAIPRPNLTGDAAWNLGIIQDWALTLNGRPYDDPETALKAQIMPWIDESYPQQIFIDHFRMINANGVPPVRIVNLPESVDKLTPTLTAKAKEFNKILVIANPKEFDALYDQKLKEWLDLGGKRVKDDLLKQFELEHKK